MMSPWEMLISAGGFSVLHFSQFPNQILVGKPHLTEQQNYGTGSVNLLSSTLMKHINLLQLFWVVLTMNHHI